jgi:hypothetical protein
MLATGSLIARALAGGLVAGLACATAPGPSAGLAAIEKNPKAVVSGVVVDSVSGEPVPGVQVIGLPHGADYPWEPAATTDSDGRFTLRLAAPAEYSFLLQLHGISIETPEADDPGSVDVVTVPGGRIDRIRLKFLRRWFEGSIDRVD